MKSAKQQNALRKALLDVETTEQSVKAAEVKAAAAKVVAVAAKKKQREAREAARAARKVARQAKAALMEARKNATRAGDRLAKATRKAAKAAAGGARKLKSRRSAPAAARNSGRKASRSRQKARSDGTPLTARFGRPRTVPGNSAMIARPRAISPGSITPSAKPPTGRMETQIQVPRDIEPPAPGPAKPPESTETSPGPEAGTP